MGKKITPSRCETARVMRQLADYAASAGLADKAGCIMQARKLADRLEGRPAATEMSRKAVRAAIRGMTLGAAMLALVGTAHANKIPPSRTFLTYDQGVCDGVRAGGHYNPHRGLAVIVIHPRTGHHEMFKCNSADPVADRDTPAAEVIVKAFE